jgi:hypothetical protein
MTSGEAFLVALTGGAFGWLFRAALLRVLRERHAQIFYSELGAPKLGQLSGYSRTRWQLQSRLLRFIWTGEFVALNDTRLTIIGLGTGISDAVLAVGIITFLVVTPK